MKSGRLCRFKEVCNLSKRLAVLFNHYPMDVNITTHYLSIKYICLTTVSAGIIVADVVN